MILSLISFKDAKVRKNIYIAKKERRNLLRLSDIYSIVSFVLYAFRTI